MTTAVTVKQAAGEPAAGDDWYKDAEAIAGSDLSPGDQTDMAFMHTPVVVAAYESRSLTLSVLVRETFDNARMNWIALAEIALAVMVTQMDLFNRLLDTTALRAGQFGLALAAAVLLFLLWEGGKLVARRRPA